MKKSTLLITAAIVSCSVGVYALTKFTDDASISDYSRPYVEALVDEGGISGYTDNTFKPQGTITRAEFLTMCMKSIAGDKVNEVISEISTDEYNAIVKEYGYNDIWNGAANKILVAASVSDVGVEFSSGSSGKAWNEPVNRAEAAQILYGILKAFGNEDIPENSGISATDKALIESMGYEEGISALYALGIVRGDSKGNYNPQNKLKREDSAILVSMALKPELRNTEVTIAENDVEDTTIQTTIETTTETTTVADSPANHYGAPIYGQTGVKSVKNFIKTAFEPVGKVMYIYGGGWNEADNAAGKEALTIGLSESWLNFAAKQNSSYNNKNYNYKVTKSVIHDGLDCSGYVGWVLYNMMNDGTGYVTYARNQGYMLQQKGYGTVTGRAAITSHGVGDIMTSDTDGHVFISLGQCSDGSVLLLHSSPPGVQLSGTTTPSGSKNSEAIALATKYMSKYYPEWYAKFPDSSRGTGYLTNYDRFEWSLLSDDEGYRNMSPEEVLRDIFNE